MNMKPDTDAITNEDVEEVVDFLADHGLEVEARTDYSGRGMYGKTCLGFVTDDVAQTMYLLAVRDGAEGDNLFNRRVETDSMGLSRIVYFPGLAVQEDA